MKPLLAVVLLFLFTSLAMAQSATSASPQPPATAAQPKPMPSGLEPILAQIQRSAAATKDDLSGLRIERWKTDADQKAEFTKIADSLRRNLTSAIPGLISDVRSSRGSVSTTFKLYHNLNVVYEYMNYLADSASALGKDTEYSPLAREAVTVDRARQDLSTFIEQAASTLEEKVRVAETPPPPVVDPAPKKIVVDEAPKKPATGRKKKTSPPAPQPVSTPI